MSNLPLKKILRDPWYAAIYRATKSLELVERAGFFDDKLDDRHTPSRYYALDFDTTPIQHLSDRLTTHPPGRTAYVLLTTGGFSPVHRGHIAMMEAAKRHLECQGKSVLGGYLSPSHDSYVSKKYGGAAALAAHHRIELCQKALVEHPWIMVDPWEARYTPRTVNFTNVIERLHGYISRRFPSLHEIRIVYVCGSDNAEFAHAFRYGGGDMICVGRAGSTEHFARLRHEFYPERDRIHFLKPTRASGCSSRMVRAGSHADIPASIRSHYQKLVATSQQPSTSQSYLIRDEGSWATAPWNTKYDRNVLEQSYHRFAKRLGRLIEQSFAGPSTPDQPRTVSCRYLHLAKQHALIALLTQKTISLDAATPGTHNLSLSRAFSLSDGQHTSLGLVERPGSLPLNEQCQNIPAGSYTLIDDDIGSGFTMRHIASKLPTRVTINAWTILSKIDPNAPADVLDIIDTRDFLVGARDGGLVVKLPDGTLARAPYALPYVSLISRAKIPPSQEIALSKKIWRLNHDWYKKFSSLTLSDTSPHFQKLMRYIGFASTTPMHRICARHLERLTYLTRHLWKNTSNKNSLTTSNSRTAMPTIRSAKNTATLSRNLKNISRTALATHHA